MTRVAVVKMFFDKDATRLVTSSEFMAFWKSCNEEERQEFAESAARQLGVELS